MLPHSMDDGVVAGLRAIPALVAVHREVAAADGRDPGILVALVELRLQRRHEVDRGARRRVTAIEQRVQPEDRHVLAPRELGEGDDVPVVGVHPARPDEPDDVEPALRLPRAAARIQERRPFEEGPVGDGGVDPRQVLEHRPAGADVEVADLGVAHLSGRQADRLARGLEPGIRPAPEQPAPDRRVGRRDRVGGGVAADPEAVDDDEDDRPRPVGCHHQPRITPRRGPRQSGRRGRRSRPSRPA